MEEDDDASDDTIENSGLVVPASSQAPAVPTAEFNVMSTSEQPPQFGDTNIHTTGPVYTAPVRQTVIFQQVEQPHSSSIPTPEHEETREYEELCASLKEKVKEIACGESSLAEFSERPILPVNLSIVSKPIQVDDEFQAEGHHFSRDDLSDILKPPMGDIAAEEMFPQAKEAARREADRKIRPDQEETKKAYVERYGNVVGVIGPAGIGKTTSTKKWALQALVGDLFQNISFFFYIFVRLINFERRMTFFEFLFSTMLPTLPRSSLKIQSLLEKISVDPAVLLIFDGLDEAAFESFSKEVPLPQLHSKDRAENFLKHLASGNLLPRARKIFTSRPAQFYKLSKSYRPKFVVEILGLTPRSQDELGRQICGQNYHAVKEKLSHSHKLFAYCYVPVNFILTCNFLMNYSGDTRSVSMSRVLAYTCAQYVQTEHLKGSKQMLHKLAELAWKGIASKKIIFDLGDFQDAEINESVAEAFLHTSITKQGNMKLAILNGHKRKYFSHLIWQEFFAAVYLMMVMPMADFRQQYEKLLKNQWEVVSWFAFGLCDRSVHSDLELVVPKQGIGVFQQKKALLKELIGMSTHYVAHTTGISTWALADNTVLQMKCHWAHEANDEEITSLVYSILPSTVGFKSRALDDLENLTFVLRERRDKKLDSFSIFGLRLRRIDIQLVASGLHNFNVVKLIDCGIDEIGVTMLCEQMETFVTPLDTLCLSGNVFGNAGAESLAQCITSFKELYVRQCGIGPAGATCLSQKILKNPLQLLNMHGNPIGDAGAISMSSCVHNVSQLDVSKCGITDRGMGKLCEKIAALQDPMKKLVISGDDLTSKSAQALKACAHNIIALFVTECTFTEEEKRQIEAKDRKIACL